jgi:hypothetical protein
MIGQALANFTGVELSHFALGYQATMHRRITLATLPLFSHTRRISLVTRLIYLPLPMSQLLQPLLST